jgi:RHS repeat-associated protein
MVRVYNDYYVFGMEMPGRSYSPTAATHGFNGKEKINEINNIDGATYDFGARMYDARVARFMSIDREVFRMPWTSGYGFAINNPMLFADFEGLRPIARTLMRNGFKFKITIDDERPQYIKIEEIHFGFRVGKKLDREFGAGGNKTSAALVRTNDSELPPSTGSYLDTPIGTSSEKASDILTDYLSLYDDLSLDIIGNHNVSDGNFRRQGNPYNPPTSAEQFAIDRARWTKEYYFKNLSNVNAFGRSEITVDRSNMYKGVELSKMHTDAMGITLLFDFKKFNPSAKSKTKTENKNENENKMHRNVRFL